MVDKQRLLDAFASLRGTWDDLVSLQPDIVSAGGPLSELDLIELRKRVEAHAAALVAFAGAIADPNSPPAKEPDVWR